MPCVSHLCHGVYIFLHVVVPAGLRSLPRVAALHAGLVRMVGRVASAERVPVARAAGVPDATIPRLRACQRGAFPGHALHYPA